MMNRQIMIVVMLAILATSVAAQVEFTFEGFSKVDPIQDQPGSIVEIFGIANPPAGIPNPIPLDFDNNQYTISVTGLLIDTFAWDQVAGIKEVVFLGGEFAIYEDAIGGTPGDWADIATFTDGDMLLHGMVDNGWRMMLDDPFGWGIYSGSAIGTCDLDGGSAIPLMEIIGYPFADWDFIGTGISDPNPPFITIPDGYDRVFGLKLMYPQGPTGNDDVTWGQLKNIFSD